MRPNVILDTDSYKLSHPEMMALDTQAEESYLEARLGPDTDPYPETVWFGLQPILQRLAGPVVSRYDVDEAEAFQAEHMPGTRFNRTGWDRIVDKWGGQLPVTICAAPEGSVIPRGNVLMTVCSEAEPWLGQHLEGVLEHVWYPMTVATRDYFLAHELRKVAVQTGSDPAGVAFQVHDFGFRGVSSCESAGIGGGAHLMVFRGSDTMRGQRWLTEHYGAPLVSAGSVAATQHAIMTQNGRAGEHALIDRLIQAHPNQILSIVADSYDYRAFVDAVIDRYPSAKGNKTAVVIRPDSVYDDLSPAAIVLWTLQRIKDRLAKAVTQTRTGHHVLPFKVLWGDGIDDAGMLQIAWVAQQNGYASENLVFGSGGWLLQKCHRDTLRVAYKLSARKVDGVWQDVAKDPLDRGKRSKAGRLMLTRDSHGQYLTVSRRGSDAVVYGDQVLRPVFRNGMLLQQETFDTIRERIAAELARRPLEVPTSIAS